MTIGYATEQDLTDYAAARGITLTGTPSVLLTRALDWLEIQPFKGEKTDPDQPLQFPRDGSDSVPDNVKTAQLVAALIYDSGDDPLAPIGPRVTQETVTGAVSVSYSDRGNQTTLYPQLSALLRDYISASGASFEVVRA